MVRITYICDICKVESLPNDSGFLKIVKLVLPSKASETFSLCDSCLNKTKSHFDRT